MSKEVLVENDKPIEVDLKIKSKLEYLSLVRGFIQSFTQSNSFDKDSVYQITLVLDEAVANVIEHGYKLDENHEIHLKFKLTPEKIIIEIYDNTEGYDLTKKEEVNLKEHKKARKNRGLGVHIIRKIMDEVYYDLGGKEKGNKLTLVKYLK